MNMAFVMEVLLVLVDVKIILFLDTIVLKMQQTQSRHAMTPQPTGPIPMATTVLRMQKIIIAIPLNGLMRMESAQLKHAVNVEEGPTLQCLPSVELVTFVTMKEDICVLQTTTAMVSPILKRNSARLAFTAPGRGCPGQRNAQKVSSALMEWLSRVTRDFTAQQGRSLRNHANGTVTVWVECSTAVLTNRRELIATRMEQMAVMM
mmetsp:Transcript_17658/g.23257  ORF Transcript_17658/g.23257 Transcript_17658/m.23257 type:complete len:205 (+) Transcript_17658:383-997(+)